MTAWKFNYCLDRIKNKDTQALADIYNEYYEIMTFTALIRVKEIETAKDISSDFIKYILENAGEIGYIKNPKAWLLKSVTNRSIDFIRKNKKSMYISDCDEKKFIANDNSELYNALIESFKNLTQAENELVLLHFIYGFKYKEISIKLNMPVGTIKRKIFEIKQKLDYLKSF